MTTRLLLFAPNMPRTPSGPTTTRKCTTFLLYIHATNGPVLAFSHAVV